MQGHFKGQGKGCTLTARLPHLCLVPGKVGLKPGTGEREGETGNCLDSTFPPTSKQIHTLKLYTSLTRASNPQNLNKFTITTSLALINIVKLCFPILR